MASEQLTAFLEARDFLFRHRDDYQTAYRDFRWPAAYALQLGAGLLRRHGRRQHAHGSLGGRGRRHGDAPVLRPDGGALQPGGQLHARGRDAARRPAADDARQRGAALGPHAGGHQDGGGRDPGDDAAGGRRPARPPGARQRAPRRHRSGQHGEIRGVAGRLQPHLRRRHRPRLDSLRGGLPPRPGLHPGRPDPRGRPAAALFHLGHDHQAQARAAHAPELHDRPPLDHVLDRPAAGRRAPEHQLPGLGQARLELLLRALERGLLRLHLQLRPLQRQGPARGAGPLRR